MNWIGLYNSSFFIYCQFLAKIKHLCNAINISERKESGNCTVGADTIGKRYSLASDGNKILDSDDATNVIYTYFINKCI